ncbi:MAG: hypothetical protein JSV12_06245 [Candidatus Bathyarchaeota archaeon]|nr:MAG: hypothetical protein JSV12_06245 [Candidatus Bathyarchaeota archaeon]
MSDDILREQFRGLFAFLILMALFILIMSLDSSAAVDFLGFRLRIQFLVNIYVVLWGAYAFFMTLGYSDDIFSEKICGFFKKAGRLFLIVTFVFTIILVILIVWFLIPF